MTDAGVARFRESGGFWVPNEFIDLHAPMIGSRGVYLYCVLLRSITPKHYPNFSELATLTCLPRTLVRRLLLQLYDLEVLNNYDMEKIFGQLIVPTDEDDIWGTEASH